MNGDNTQNMLITFIMYPVMWFACAYQNHSQWKQSTHPKNIMTFILNIIHIILRVLLEAHSTRHPMSWCRDSMSRSCPWWVLHGAGLCLSSIRIGLSHCCIMGLVSQSCGLAYSSCYRLVMSRHSPWPSLMHGVVLVRCLVLDWLTDVCACWCLVTSLLCQRMTRWRALW